MNWMMRLIGLAAGVAAVAIGIIAINGIIVQAASPPDPPKTDVALATPISTGDIIVKGQIRKMFLDVETDTFSILWQPLNVNGVAVGDPRTEVNIRAGTYLDSTALLSTLYTALGDRLNGVKAK